MSPRDIFLQAQLDPERVAYWYFRLNGFLQIENFVVHPGGKGSQRTDADLLAVRFPHRSEFLFDHDKPMRDDAARLNLSSHHVDVMIVEIKTNQRCTLNGPWTDENEQNIHRVLAAIGCLQNENIHAAAIAIYERGEFMTDQLRVRLVAVGRTADVELARRYKRITQLTWAQMLSFIWHRFDAYRKQKSDVQQWDEIGQGLMSMARKARTREYFVNETLRAMGICDEK
jgi:hypothetical protein